MGFDQHNKKHQDWLSKWAEHQGFNGFYDTQDLADLLQGSPSTDIAIVANLYRSMRGVLTMKEWLTWLAGQRAKAGINVSPWWQDAEDKARLMEFDHGDVV